MFLVAAALVALLALAGCTDSDNDDPADADDPAGSSSSTSTTGDQGIAPQPDEVSITVAAVGTYPIDPAFDPADLAVPAGALVHVTFNNNEANGLSQHDWVVEGIDGAATQAIAPGGSITVDFTAPAQAGQFTFFCSIGDHRSRGMEGTLSVTVS